MTSFRECRNLVLLSLKDGQQMMLKLSFYKLIWSKHSWSVSVLVIKDPELLYEGILSTWLRWLFASRAFHNPVEESRLRWIVQFPFVFETSIYNEQTLHLIPGSVRKWNKDQFESVHLFAQCMLSRHVTIVFPIKTFHNLLKILQDCLRKILWHI